MLDTIQNEVGAKPHEKTVTIVVNGRQKEVLKEKLSFDEIIALAFDNPPSGENILFTVTYRKGHSPKSEGTLVKGQEVNVKEGMVFNVTATDKS